MNRINQLFKKKPQNILSIYFTAGFPYRDATLEIIKALEAAGADMLEIGIPFSDPLADGPTIQASSQKALENGMSLALLFEQLADIRKYVDIPLLLMGYLNPVYQFGVEKFCRQCKATGIDGLILPDLPLDVYETQYQNIFEKYELSNIFLITPETTDSRIRKIDATSNGFIYMVAASSTTGAKKNIAAHQEAYFKRIQSMNLQNPRIIGFGISNNQTFTRACRYANGAIIGSAFIHVLTNSQNISEDITTFIRKIRNG